MIRLYFPFFLSLGKSPVILNICTVDLFLFFYSFDCFKETQTTVFVFIGNQLVSASTFYLREYIVGFPVANSSANIFLGGTPYVLCWH